MSLASLLDLTLTVVDEDDRPRPAAAPTLTEADRRLQAVIEHHETPVVMVRPLCIGCRKPVHHGPGLRVHSGTNLVSCGAKRCVTAKNLRLRQENLGGAGGHQQLKTKKRRQS